MKFEIAPKETATKLTWEDAKLYCFSLNANNKTGWRLPTLEELYYVRENLDSNFGHYYYWSSESTADRASCVFMGGYMYPSKDCTRNSPTTFTFYVRAVRDLS